jgi:DNA-binding MarR family transcriptional regulator
MTTRQERVSKLSQLIGRDLATKTSVFQDAMAERLGLGITDLKCLDLLNRALMPLTPVNLAELTGLTSGAITGVADRLEVAGFVERIRSQTDRRRWELRLLANRQKEVAALLEPLGEAVTDLCRGLSDDEIKTVSDFVTNMIPVLDQETHRLRG